MNPLDFKAILGIIVVSITVAIILAGILIVFKKQTKLFIKKSIYSLKLKFSHAKKRLTITRFLFKTTKNIEGYNYVDFIFDSFAYFYEHSMSKELEWIELPREQFPKGIVDVVEVFRYVSKIRKENKEEYSQIISGNGNLKVWGIGVENFSAKRLGFRIKITPIEGEGKGNPTVSMVNLENLIYDIDTEVAVWIVERRKFFGI